MTRGEILDASFIDARARLIDLAAFLDRVERGKGDADFRLPALQSALAILSDADPEKARRVLLAFSDPTHEPLPTAPGKPACGAFEPPPVNQ